MTTSPKMDDNRSLTELIVTLDRRQYDRAAKVTLNGDEYHQLRDAALRQDSSGGMTFDQWWKGQGYDYGTFTMQVARNAWNAAPQESRSGVLLVSLLKQAQADLIWCGGSADFGPEGKAKVGYDKGPRVTIAAIAAALASRAEPGVQNTPGEPNRDLSTGTSHSEPDGPATKPTIPSSQGGASQGTAPILSPELSVDYALTASDFDKYDWTKPIAAEQVGNASTPMLDSRGQNNGPLPTPASAAPEPAEIFAAGRTLGLIMGLEDAAKVCDEKANASSVDMFSVAMRLAATAIRAKIKPRTDEEGK